MLANQDLNLSTSFTRVIIHKIRSYFIKLDSLWRGGQEYFGIPNQSFLLPGIRESGKHAISNKTISCLYSGFWNGRKYFLGIQELGNWWTLLSVYFDLMFVFLSILDLLQNWRKKKVGEKGEGRMVYPIMKLIVLIHLLPYMIIGKCCHNNNEHNRWVPCWYLCETNFDLCCAGLMSLWQFRLCHKQKQKCLLDCQVRINNPCWGAWYQLYQHFKILCKNYR